MTFTPWEYFVQLTWIFFIFGWLLHILTWYLTSVTKWINVALSSSFNEALNDN